MNKARTKGANIKNYQAETEGAKYEAEGVKNDAGTEGAKNEAGTEDRGQRAL